MNTPIVFTGIEAITENEYEALLDEGQDVDPDALFFDTLMCFIYWRDKEVDKGNSNISCSAAVKQLILDNQESIDLLKELTSLAFILESLPY